MSFFDLGLHRNILRAISDIGYVKPFYIQKKCIPYVLKGRDVLGLAETGSGKTAAFLLPLLHNIDPVMLFTQVLVLVPTRELAIQLKNVCSVFSKYIQGINIVSLYGGQCYDIQFRFLKQCPQIVIGTPGRLLDHLKRRTLCLSKLHSLVIDEADEMLRMGFIDDVKLITSKVPENHQTIFFSATLPKEIRRIARSFMNNPKEIYINLGEDKILIPSFIEQNYLIVSGFHKQEALMRFLEVENFDAVIVFVRTKEATLEIASMLEENGYNSAALNGDMNQVVRQRTLERLRNGKLDILIATDVAARGLDVDRVTLVINYDAPMDIDSYIHRIGRTGRAGRNGRSLLFIKHSDYRLLRYIEKNKNLSISKVKIPSLDILMKSRLSKFSDKVKREFVNHGTDLEKYRSLLFKIKPREDCDIERLAAVLLKIAEGRRSLIISSDIKMKKVNKDCFKRGVKMSRNQIKMRHFVGKTNRRVYNSFNIRSFR